MTLSNSFLLFLQYRFSLLFTVFLAFVSLNQAATFKIDDHIISPNAGTVTVPIKVFDFTNVGAMQFTLSWDPAVLKYKSVGDFEHSTLPSELFFFGETHFNTQTSYLDNGKLPVLYEQLFSNDVKVVDGGVICSVTFDLLGDNGSSTTISFSDEPTPSKLASFGGDTPEFISKNGKVTIFEDNTAPVITLKGDATETHEAGTAYTDAGAEVTDNFDTTVTVVTSGTVDVSKLGNYVITYNASDASGNAAVPVTRSVLVKDTIPPVITLKGIATETHEAGTTYTDAGATVTDNDGSVKVTTTGSLDVKTPGSYTLTYTATDSAGNEAIPLSRTVNVVDTTGPVITLIGERTVYHTPGIIYSDAGATVTDNVDETVTITTSGTVDADATGSYTLTYSATDKAGNASSISREVIIRPKAGVNPQSTSGEAGSEVVVPFAVKGFNGISGLQFTLAWDPKVMSLVQELVGNQSLPKVTQVATVPMSGLEFPLIMPNNFSVIEPGKVTFLWDEAQQPGMGRTLEDGSALFALHFKLVGEPFSSSTLALVNDPTPFKLVTASGYAIHATSDVGLVQVLDGTPPVLTLIGDANVQHALGTTYEDAGASAYDGVDGVVEVTTTGVVDVNTMGSYILTYNAADSAGNAATPVTRTVNVVDLTPPVIRLNGKATVQHALGTTYEDAGASANDGVDGEVEITTSGVVDANKQGTYFLTYSAIDSAGNTSSMTREVIIIQVVSVNPQSASGAVGSEVMVPFAVKGFNAISGIQFTLEWDPQVMTLVQEVVGDQSLPKVTQSATITLNGSDSPLILPNNFSVMGPGKLTFLWDEALRPSTGRTLGENSTLFALHFNLVGAPGSSSTIAISNTPTLYKIEPASAKDIHEEASSGTVEILKTIVISGRVTLFGLGQTPVPGATVQIDVDNKSHDMSTGEDGYYQTTLTPGETYALSAALKTDVTPNQGVDVRDIIQLRKHILNREKLSSAMAWLAADTNLDNSIDVLDIVAIRKVILNRTSFYATDANGEAKDMFRFTRLNFKDVDPLLSFTELPEALTINYQSVSGNLSDVDFGAVKLGDANGDWTPPAGGGNTLNAMAGRIPQTQGDATIDFGSTWSDESGNVYVAIRASASQALMGLEMGLSWDARVLELEEMSSKVLSNFIPGVHSFEGSGNVRLAWDDTTLTGTILEENEPVMIYRFRRVGEGSTGLFLEQALLAGEDGLLGRMRSTSIYLGSGNRSRAGLSGAIKSIEHRNSQIELWTDTRGAPAWQLESSSRLNPGEWLPLEVLDGGQAWQQLVIPHDGKMQFLRLIPVTGAEQ